MKKLSILFLIAVILFSTCVSLADNAQEESELLVLIYLCGTDLESDGGMATLDLFEMLDAGIGLEDEVTVLVQAGGTDEWESKILESGEAGRFLVADDLYIVDESMGRLDMGNPDTLSDFVQFALDNFPAKRVGLVLWDHGAGATGGVCYDELTENSLSARDIHDALAKAFQNREQRLTFIGFDACLMSTFEVAAYLQPFADLLIASEELEPGSGWAYDKWLGALAQDPTMDAEAIGRYAVDSFIESSLDEDPDDYVTLSVTDMRQMDALIDAVDAFGQDLSEALETGQFPVISRARAQMRAFGDFANASSDMVDIAEVAWYCRQVAPDASKALASAVKEAVIYSRNSANIQSAGGLSILLPQKTKQAADEYMPNYDSLSLMTGYSDFVEAYLDQLTGDGYGFSSSSIQSTTLDLTDEQTLSWFSSFLQGQSQEAPQAYSWMDNLADYSTESSLTSQECLQIAEGYGDEVYSVQLSANDMEYLSYVEAALLQDALGYVDDEYGDEVYFDYGLVQDVFVDWEDGIVYGLFDGSWPTLEGQMVAMYDQIVSEEYTRSLIPVLVNDEEQYLLVVFNEANPYGTVTGYSEGYDSNGNPVRGYNKLAIGDVIVPLYDLIYWDEDEEMQTEPFCGEEIVVGKEPLSFGYEAVEPGDYCYTFCLNDVYGGYQFTDFAMLSYE